MEICLLYLKTKTLRIIKSAITNANQNKKNISLGNLNFFIYLIFILKYKPMA